MLKVIRLAIEQMIWHYRVAAKADAGLGNMPATRGMYRALRSYVGVSNMRTLEATGRVQLANGEVNQ